MPAMHAGLGNMITSSRLSQAVFLPTSSRGGKSTAISSNSSSSSRSSISIRTEPRAERSHKEKQKHKTRSSSRDGFRASAVSAMASLSLWGAAAMQPSLAKHLTASSPAHQATSSTPSRLSMAESEYDAAPSRATRKSRLPSTASSSSSTSSSSAWSPQVHSYASSRRQVVEPQQEEENHQPQQLYGQLDEREAQLAQLEKLRQLTEVLDEDDVAVELRDNEMVADVDVDWSLEASLLFAARRHSHALVQEHVAPRSLSRRYVMEDGSRDPVDECEGRRSWKSVEEMAEAMQQRAEPADDEEEDDQEECSGPRKRYVVRFDVPGHVDELAALLHPVDRPLTRHHDTIEEEVEVHRHAEAEVEVEVEAEAGAEDKEERRRAHARLSLLVPGLVAHATLWRPWGEPPTATATATSGRGVGSIASGQRAHADASWTGVRWLRQATTARRSAKESEFVVLERHHRFITRSWTRGYMFLLHSVDDATADALTPSTSTASIDSDVKRRLALRSRPRPRRGELFESGLVATESTRNGKTVLHVSVAMQIDDQYGELDRERMVERVQRCATQVRALLVKPRRKRQRQQQQQQQRQQEQ